MNKGTFKNLYCFRIGDEINEEEVGAADPIKLSGRLDVASRDNVLEQIKKEYVEGHPLILDLSDSDYVSTAGLSNIIKLKDEYNRDVTLTGLNEEVEALLRMANLD